MKKYPEEIKAFIAENVVGMTTKDLVDLVNAKFGTDFTVSKMKSYKSNHGLKSGIGCGTPAGHPTKLYPEEIKRFISEHYIGVGHQAMADLLNQTFGTDYTKDQMKAYYARFNLDSGLKGYFKKGHTPWNKGKKGVCHPGSVPTQFRKGHRPKNYMPVGSERINGDGYIDVKIADPNKWKAKHHIIWEEANGPVPEGYVLIFADGNRKNVELKNLVVVSRKELAILNKRGLITNDPELTRTGVTVADIYLKIGERKKSSRKRPKSR